LIKHAIDIDPDLKDTLSDENYGWIEHTARSTASKNPFVTRKNLRKALKAQGFKFN